MTGPDRYDDASRDYERFEAELIAHDQDTAQVATDDVNETEAQQVIADLIEAGRVTPVPEHRVLVHEPSDTAFESIQQLALFHQGWMAARTGDGES